MRSRATIAHGLTDFVARFARVHAGEDALHVVVRSLQDMVLEAIANKHVVASLGIAVAPSSVSALLVSLTANGRGVVRLWDVSTGQPRGTPILHPWAIRAAAFSPDGRRVAVASHDRPFSEGGSTSTSCRLFDASTGRPASPPLDHPHIYINMGEADTILCPYCATRFRFDPRLTPLEANPPDSFFADHNET